MMNLARMASRSIVAMAAALLLVAAPAKAADPIKVGMSLALTGAGAPAGKMRQAAIEKRAALKTPLTAAAIAVPLAIVAFFAWRSRSKSVAGYRRRRR